MAQGFIDRAVSARRKGSGGNQAGLAACHMRATAVAFRAWPRHRRRLEKESAGEERKHGEEERKEENGG